MKTYILLLTLVLSGCQSENKIEPKKYTVVTLDGSRYTNLTKKFIINDEVFINEKGKTITFKCPFTLIEE